MTDVHDTMTRLGVPADVATACCGWIGARHVPAAVVSVDTAADSAALDILAVTDGGVVWVQYGRFAAVEFVPFSQVRRVAAELGRPSGPDGQTVNTLVVELAGGTRQVTGEVAWREGTTSDGTPVTEGKTLQQSRPGGWARTGSRDDVLAAATAIRDRLLVGPTRR